MLAQGVTCSPGIAGAAVLYAIASGSADFHVAGGMASNGCGEHSPGKYSMVSGLVTEIVMTLSVPDDHSRHHAQARSRGGSRVSQSASR